MKKKKKITVLTVAICFATFLFTSKIMAQSGQISGSSSSSGDLYQEKDDIGVGSTSNPEARLHIFNGLYENNPLMKLKRPFLIDGFHKQYCIDPITGESNPCGTIAKTYFTVAKQGNVGVGILNPNSKFTVYGTNSEKWNSGIELLRQDGGKAFMVVDNRGLKFRTMNEGSGFYFKNLSNVTNVVIKENGFVGIGIDAPTEKLQVEGNVLINKGSLIITGNNNNTAGSNEITLSSDGYIRAREIKVDLNNIPHPDYVFKADYNLMPLEELKTFVETNKHLPNVKSEAEFKTEGSYSLGEMNLKLLEKVEELTLYILQIEERLSKVETK